MIKIQDKKRQKYEKYWSITLAYTDINSDKFRGTLRAIVNFINLNDTTTYSKELYENLQKEVSKVNSLYDTSLRKSINEFVKLGFINFQLKSYHRDCITFLEAKTNRQRRTIFSKIVYENSSFNRDVTKNSNNREINFLLKTLENIGRLSESDIAALMIKDISQIQKGFLNKEELAKAKKEAKEIKFYKRKYNQVGYFINILKKLDDLIFKNGNLYFEEDARVIFGEELRKGTKVRDTYLQRLYKNQLIEESEEKLGSMMCMLEHLDYPSLVASHIKPFIKSNAEEKYDPNNGLLLSRNMDVLFDLGYISFENDGTTIVSKKLSEELRRHLISYKLDKRFINKERMKYLEYHRKIVF